MKKLLVLSLVLASSLILGLTFINNVKIINAQEPTEKCPTSGSAWVTPSESTAGNQVTLSWSVDGGCTELHIYTNEGEYLGSRYDNTNSSSGEVGSDSITYNLSKVPQGFRIELWGFYCDSEDVGLPVYSLSHCTDLGATVSAPASYTVYGNTYPSAGGTISPLSQSITSGSTADLVVSTADGYSLDSVVGTAGTGCASVYNVSGSTYRTGEITSDCTVTANFAIDFINGLCSDPDIHYTCIDGTSGNNSSSISGTTTTYSWSCNGSGGGTNDSCSENVVMSGSISAPSSCTIPTNASSCSVTLTWSTTNPQGTSAVTTPTNITVATGNDGSQSVSIPYDSKTFYLYNNANLLDQVTVSSGCGSGDSWDTSSSSCVSSPVETIPSVSTSNISNITSSGATGGGTISSDGGATVSVSGIVWNTTGSPTTANSKTTDGWAIGGPWSSNMSGLSASTKYYVKAYATNAVGTAYGSEVSFTTSATSTMSGTITPSATSCTIPLGGSSCTVNLSWSTTNPVVVGGSALTSPYPVANTIVGSGDSGTVNDVTIPYNDGNGRDFYLYNNAEQLDFENVAANCGVYTWSVSEGKCVSGGSSVSGVCSDPDTHYACSAGTSIDNVDGASAWTWTCQGSGGGTDASCSENKPAQPAPNLTADNPTPTTAVKSTAVTLSSTIWNIGNASTGESFSNFFQVCNGSGPCASPTDLAPTVMPALNFGANDTTTKSHTFSDVGTYSIRACADKTNKDGGGVITESDETDNCSLWVDVNVSLASGTWGPWSDCVNGVKTRVCTPTGTCSGSATVSCSTPKFKEN
jgi:hypothetical protein